MWSVTPAPAQQNQSPGSGAVSDWTHYHVIFSNPGTLLDAVMDGKREEWQHIVNDPRYRMQQIKRSAAFAERTTTPKFGFPGPPRPPEGPSFPIFRKNTIHSDWAVQIAGGSNGGVAIDMYPAKYTFAPIGSPDCTNDFVVFPISGAGQASQQGNIYGVNNLYSGFCTTGSVPNTLFNYFVGTGKVQTSPVLSLNGAKVAFVESVTSGSIFHVVTIDKSGNSGCPNATPCNGNVFNSPAVPGTFNSAVDKKITMSGGVSVTRSSPFVNYSGDIAYIGDDTGKLHKFTGVFLGTPAEAGSPWPFTVASGVILTGPVFDGGASGNIFVGGSNGKLYCVTSAGAVCSTASITVGTGPILDAPIVDSTTEKVFAEANNTTTGFAVLTQATTSLGSQVNANMGKAATGTNGTTDLYNGAFDNAYFTNVSTGHMYFCGNLTTAATPALWRVTFNSTGTMSNANDGNFFQLVQTGQTGTAVDCTPLTEVNNTSKNIDFLFLGVKDNGNPTGCNGNTCGMGFSLPTSSPFTFPTSTNAITSSNLGSLGISGIIIDNVSGTTGASQIYFGNLQLNTGVQFAQ
jgi:hypothetical protein